MRLAGAFVALLLAVAAATWFLERAPYSWNIPAEFPVPAVPADNPMSGVKAELGRRLFYDRRLSVSGNMSCASCHSQALAFTDGLRQSIGATGELHPRNAMSLVNSAYASRLTWANNLISRIEDQMLTPLFGENPVEMGLAGREKQLVAMLKADTEYRRLFAQSFPSDSEPESTINLVRAIATFVRTIVSFDSPYDNYLRGNMTAMSEAAIRGMDLFFSERLECFHCHGGFNFTDSSTHASATVASIGYHNTGLYNIGGRGDYPADNTGLFDMTGLAGDMGRFKAPSLRNVAVTAPYMHDGSVATLNDVIDHYQRGGREITAGPYQGDGRHNPYKSQFVQGFELGRGERADLIAFLEALTDEHIINDERWSNPWKPQRENQ